MRDGRPPVGLAEGDDFRDVCRDPACDTCALWQRPDETRSAWLARVGGLYREAAYPNSNQKREGAA